MEYIDYLYYTNTFKGVPITVDVFDSLVGRASMQINQMAGGKIESVGFDKLPVKWQEAVKMATAAQVEYLDMNGGIQGIYSTEGNGSTRIGKFSYSEGSKTRMGGIDTSNMVLGYLKGTGLLFRGVKTCG